MRHVQRKIFQGLVAAGTASLFTVAAFPAIGAEPPSESHLQRLMETAAQAPRGTPHDGRGEQYNNETGDTGRIAPH